MGLGKNEQGKSIVSILILILLLGGLGAGGFFGFKFYKEKTQGPSKESLPHNKMNEALIRFTFDHLPSLYAKLDSINKEINLINSEIARLDALESSYPQQKSLIKAERVIWDKTQKSLLTVLQTFEKNIETLYVTFKLNEEKGKELISSKLPELESAAEEVLKTSRVETSRIKAQPPQSILEKLKAKFLKK